MLRQLTHAARQRVDRRRVQLERMIGRIARDDGSVHARIDCLPNCVSEAAVDFDEGTGRVMEIRELCDPHGSARRDRCQRIHLLDDVGFDRGKKLAGFALNASIATSTRRMPFGFRFQPAPYFRFA